MPTTAATPQLVLADQPDPLTRASVGEESHLAACVAGDLFGRELDRYLRGRISGLSLLVAGHRGSGKTTLVRAAVGRAVRQSRGEGSVRPLPVLLNGPDLLPDPSLPVAVTEGESPPVSEEPGERRGDGPTPTDPAAASPAAKENLATQRVLTQITIALYRALARELAAHYRERLLFPGPHATRRADGAELAAHLELELDDAPDPPLLRDFWARGGVLETGVLFEPGRRQLGQGMHELVALATAAQAYRVVSGVYDTTRKLTASDQLERSRTTERSGGLGKDALPAGLGLLTGAVTGTGLLLDGAATGLSAGAATVLAGLIGTWAVKTSVSRGGKRALTREYTFIRSNSVSTLDRELPVLVDRIRAAGLAPVFVVDELDKVADLPARMGALVQHLKQFVTERTFFCFLTDRYYFEHVDVATEANPYPRAHTYFSHRLFVTYRPQELREYVSRLLVPTARAGTELERAELDREALTFMLVFSARGHPFDLRGALAGIVDSQGGLRMTPGAVRTHLGYRFQIAMQLAIEHLLEGEDMRHRLDQDPYFGQIAYDALYYPARLWTQGKVLDASRAGLERHLSERIRLNREESRERERDSATNRASSGGDPPLGEAIGDVLGHADRAFLHEQLRRLVALLGDPDGLVGELARHDRLHVSTRLLRAVPVRTVGLRDPRLLEPDPQRPEAYQWRFDPFGRALLGQPPREVSDEDIRADQVFIREVEAFVRSLTGGAHGLDELALRVGVLAPTPDWHEVDSAMARLASYDLDGQITEYDQLVDDKIAVDEYARMLERHDERLFRALVLAHEIGSVPHIAASGNPPLADGLNAMAEVLNLGAEMDSGRIDSLLRELTENLRPLAVRLERYTVPEWERVVREVLDGTAVLPEAEPPGREAIQLWRERMDAYLAGERMRFPATRLDLLYRAAGGELSYLLHPDLGEMSANRWCMVVERVFAPPSVDEWAPLWLVVPSLVALGLGPAIPVLLDRIQRQDTPFPTRPEWLGEDGDLARTWWERHHASLGWDLERPSVLVLAEHPSIAFDWRPSTRYAALVIDLASWYDDAVLGWFIETVRSVSPFRAVLWQFAQGTFAATRAASLLERFLEMPNAPVFEVGPLQSDMPGSRFLGEPATLDEAVTRVLRLVPEPEIELPDFDAMKKASQMRPPPAV